MVKLIPVKYHKRNYPSGIKPKCQEIAAHFDITKIDPEMNYSLHTEYSYGARKLNSETICRFNELCNACKKGVPQLWFNENWSREFFEYLKVLIGFNKAPEIIEVHPPFADYCGDVRKFLDRYVVFEKLISNEWPNTLIFVENRAGSTYRGKSFLVSKIESLISLDEEIRERDLKLRIVLDVPQVFTAHRKDPETLSEQDISDFLHCLRPCMSSVKGLHLWGKRRSPKGSITAHCGDINSFVGGRSSAEISLMSKLFELCNDGIDRYFVPEVNSGDEDLRSIVESLVSSGFSFV